MTNNTIKIIIIEKDGKKREVYAQENETVLQLARRLEIDLEGACEGSLACSTCHVILSEKHYSKLPPATEEEEDMLDLAFGLEQTSRLGCQVSITKSLEGMIIKIPSETRNMSAKDNAPKKNSEDI
ncbi:ferredoxin [Rickettsiales bacterium]|nr:ferredoxin [Rickettsiales bacterium]